MIIGIIHKGSGLGDQVFSYIATRVRAADLGVDFGFVGKEFFKGASFMNIDWGKETDLVYDVEPRSGAVIVNSDKVITLDKPYYNPEINFIPDGSIIDGYGAQDIRYFEHRLDEVREWLKFMGIMSSGERREIRKELDSHICIINFRGGEYASVSDLFLPQEYWDKAIQMMQDKYPKIKFEVHTDDNNLANKFFPDFDIVQDIYFNWQAIRYAKHLIISNSAFAILPALLNENVKEVIAPFGWNARNASQTEWLGRPGNYYKKFTYI